jgi:hypothetical protein
LRVVKQTWPGEEFVTRVVVKGKRKEDGDNVGDLECALRRR